MKIFRSNIIWNFCLWALFVIVLNGCFILGGGVSQKDGKQKGKLEIISELFQMERWKA